MVLTAPSGEFVDIRLPKDAKSPDEASKHPSFWAFSGRAITTFHDATGQHHPIDMPYTAHCKFLHEIDSRGPDISDEGDMFLLMNGDCLEMGIMENPATGTKDLYKEYWHSAERLPNPDGEDDDSVCIVAQASNPASVQGIVIRSGGRVQGITSRKEKDGRQIVEVERWIRDRNMPLSRPVNAAGESRPPGPWSRDIRSSSYLPCGWLCLSGRYVGESLEFNGILWKIVEVH